MRKTTFCFAVACVALAVSCTNDGTGLATGTGGAGGSAQDGTGGSAEGGSGGQGQGGAGGGGRDGSSGGQGGGGGGQPDGPLTTDVVLKKDGPPDSDGASDICASGGLCQTIEADYAKAVSSARQCVPGAAGQCTKQVSSSLGCPGCAMWVNSTEIVDAQRKRWTDAGCERCLRFRACPAIACLPLVTGVCQRQLGATYLVARPVPPPPGVCVDQRM